MARKDQRRLSAILAADVVGYSRMMAADETGTLSALREVLADIVAPRIEGNDGRIVKQMGDGVLAEFASAVDAVQCAVDIQVLTAKHGKDVADDRRIVFRIGINIGDVIVEGDDIFGDGVNVAARLESAADPGGVLISQNVLDQVSGRVPFKTESRGDKTFKNIDHPVAVHAVRLDNNAAQTVKPIILRQKPGSLRRAVPAFIAVLAALGFAVAGYSWFGSRSSQGTTQLAADARPAIAVLPFENLSGRDDQEYFADGLADDLITDLSKVSGLLVIARNSSFAYRDRKADIKAIGNDLNARYVLDGSVRRSGDLVRINARLLDAGNGNMVWADRFDRKYEDIFAIQDEVIGGIIKALSVNLTTAEQTQLARLPTENLEAWDYYLRAERLAYRAEIGSVSEALELYQQAFTRDPQFADAYAGYARVAVDILNFGYFDRLPSAVARKRAYEAASRATRLDPALARSYSVLALMQMIDGEHETAIESARQATSISPNNAEAHLNLAVVLIYAGRHGEALKEIDTVLRLNPKAGAQVYDYQALALFLEKQPQAALDVLDDKNVSKASDLRLEMIAGANARLGNMEEARRAVAEMIRRVPEVCVAANRILSAHHARADDLDYRLESLIQAGLPQWPNGYSGNPDNRLSEAELETLVSGTAWSGDRVGIGPFYRHYDSSGVFVERGRGYQFSGTVTIRDQMVCTRSKAMMLDRENCGPVFRAENGADGTSQSYEHPNALGQYRFTVSQ